MFVSKGGGAPSASRELLRLGELAFHAKRDDERVQQFERFGMLFTEHLAARLHDLQELLGTPYNPMRCTRLQGVPATWRRSTGGR